MIELTNNSIQTVLVGQNVLFTETAVHSGCAERHREGSGQITLVQPGRYLVSFTGNIAVPTGGTAGEVDLAVAVQGEALSGSTMRATPTVVGAYFNVATQHYVDVPRTCCGGSCCQTVSVINNGTQGVSVQDPNITAVRVCG